MGPTTTRHVAELVPAAPLALHAPPLRRTDCNSPVHVHDGRLFAFVSRHEPRGHAYRRVAPARGGVGDGLRALGAPVPVRIVDDPDPAVGKWIESTWRDARGRLHGWYHAEEPAPAPARLFVPHIGALASDDDGATWRCLGEALRAPAGLVDTGAANGFMAGGYGDFSVVADREARFLYIHFSSYVADERAQGVAVARYPVAARDAPAGAVEIWRDGGWRPARGTLPTPLWPVARGWRHA
ncbi:MAG: hypothetical protein JNL07_06060, partial [Rhodospirillales bacterium]|nr:hypothetical protein [Rhodospirillales bacterium]